MWQHYFLSPHSLQQLPWEGLDLVLQTFLEQHLTPTTLLRLFLHLQPWICSPRAQERSRALKASARLFMFYHFKAITEDLKPMAEQGYAAGLLTSQAFDVQEATRYWASQALYWLFMPCKAIVHTKTGAVATVLSKTQKDASCRESPAHVAMLIAKHLPSRDLVPFTFTLLVGLLEKGECADQLAGIMEVVLRENQSELQGQWTQIDVEDGNASRVLKSHSGAEAAQACCHQGRTTCGLWELVGALGQADTLEGLEDDLFTSCFLAIACSRARRLLGAEQDLPSDASPRSMAVQAQARVLHLRGSQPAVELMDQEQGWAMVIHPKQALKSIPWLLLPSLQASQEGECMACTVLLAEFLSSPLLIENEPKAMRKQVVKAKLQRTEDSTVHIRGRALHGLRNAILGSFVCAVCECCDPRTVLEAMEGVCCMLQDPKAPLKAHVAVPLALQARMFFEDKNTGLRRASMELFGHLSKFVCKKSSLFRAEVEKSMRTLLIHLQDRDPQLAQVSAAEGS
ncbi:Disintegrin and metalloproteinase domain-containing protein 2 [Platysternon megacephalum]|uniref:Disintegrin and metalloproteinase domain-containing protein 2 n=1 Tax=Platysternon megacephalum TaxID=55544 RepID=A0A4D9EFV7_9SAUR|nr:Disintegrin and metalloproteinase domain-containing protein 2 [Platysternon megacephalum]